MQQQKIILSTPEELSAEIVDAISRHVIPLIRSEIQSIAQANTEKEQDLLTRSEAAKFLHCDKVSLWNYEKRGWVKPIRMGRKVFYSKRHLLEFMQNH